MYIEIQSEAAGYLGMAVAFRNDGKTTFHEGHLPRSYRTPKAVRKAINEALERGETEGRIEDPRLLGEFFSSIQWQAWECRDVCVEG